MAKHLFPTEDARSPDAFPRVFLGASGLWRYARTT